MEYRLQRMDVGLVLLDAGGRIRSLNRTAERFLGPAERLVGTALLDLHPPETRAKVEFLLAAAGRADASAQACSMIVALPGRVLVVKATRLPLDGGDGTALMLIEASGQTEAPEVDAPPPLVKLPVTTRQGVALVDPTDVLFVRADGHYTAVHTASGAHLCTLSLAELEARLDPTRFLRVHRGYLVNLCHAGAVERTGDRTLFVMAAPGAPRVPVSRSRTDELKRRLAL
ncbi:PAS domain-containing transcriptional regulator [Azospirillum sp. RWY-5-1]|uniref:PAS domain-containing transcriptional regulator n=1 Tax=Azospirillum oleiclasticum TaxID=2735135 RepID=A0ABX2T7W7_9PROT|nr:LytTR family transcriptional regulator DNA-binding domain-containing protein [Azospirillum oleiclasticum]NYZ11879.1 PAS domain-containing transcriptional regulator [Azospirillum oleiclasticum]NYZ19039.1 PAS domain-containing transcriptional regulator [Azospirillum oleiclasticum]